MKAWEDWREEFPELSKLSVPRNYMKGSESLEDAQMHIFADASVLAFGAAAYVRIKAGDTTLRCSFVLGKTRLAPIKPLTIPRLELQAAVIAGRIRTTIIEELNTKVNQITYWTDSMTVHQYIKGERTRFHTFVSNRVVEIRESSDPCAWRNVPGYLNVADDCSRGLLAYDLIQQSRRVHGPNFLLEDESELPKQKTCHPPDIEDPEVKADVWSGLTTEVRVDIFDPSKRWRSLKEMKTCG